MELINYVIALVACFLGLFVGVLIAYLTKEEFKELKKSMNLAAFGIISGLAISTFMFYDIVIWISIPSVILIMLAVHYIRVSDYFIFALLGALFYISSFEQDLLLVNSFLIFAFAVLSGTFRVHERKISWHKLVLDMSWKYSAFLIVGIVLFLA